MMKDKATIDHEAKVSLAIWAEEVARRTDESDDWRIAASAWRDAGDQFKYEFCLGMAEAS